MAKKTEYNSSWDFFFTSINDKPASIYVDLGLKNIAPAASHPYALCVKIRMKYPAQDGLSTKKESDALFKIEDALVKDMENDNNSIFAGRVTCDNNREFFFYCESKGAEKTVIKSMSGFPEYSYTKKCTQDKSWKEYSEFLYPVPAEMQTILNRRVIQNLRERGDSLGSPREVSHYIYFKTADERDTYASEAGKQGFKTASAKLNKENGSSHPYSLRLVKTESVDPQSVDDSTMYLFDLAEKHNGSYDGWETMLINNQN